MDVVETTFDTDFAILSAYQSTGPDSDVGTFALTTHGALSASCGTKYARVHVRAERWDSRPPVAENWEDADELPFVEVPDGGPMEIAGFDPSSARLDVTGIGNARVQVYATGRHRYYYGDDVLGDALPPEQWLLRFFPTDGDPDPLAGGPRRLAGEGALYRNAPDPWSAALRAVEVSGWYEVLWPSAVFQSVRSALWSAGGPTSEDELARLMVRRRAPFERGGADALDQVIPPSRDEPDQLAELTGRATPLTAGEALDAMLDLGLLVSEERTGVQLLIPNPAPEPAWVRRAREGHDPDSIRRIRLNTLRHLHGLLATDLSRALRWAGVQGLRSTPRKLALRLATTVDEVRGALRYLIVSGYAIADTDIGFETVLEADQAVWIRHRLAA